MPKKSQKTQEPQTDVEVVTYADDRQVEVRFEGGNWVVNWVGPAGDLWACLGVHAIKELALSDARDALHELSEALDQLERKVR